MAPCLQYMVDMRFLSWFIKNRKKLDMKEVASSRFAGFAMTIGAILMVGGGRLLLTPKA